MRKVKVFKYERNPETNKYDKVKKSEEPATFHQFGCNYDEFETGAGNYSTAIIEWPDGKVENVPVDLIQFVD